MSDELRALLEDEPKRIPQNVPADIRNALRAELRPLVEALIAERDELLATTCLRECGAWQALGLTGGDAVTDREKLARFLGWQHRDGEKHYRALDCLCIDQCFNPTTDDYIAACEARGWEVALISEWLVDGKGNRKRVRSAQIGGKYRETLTGDLRAALEAAILSALEDER